MEPYRYQQECLEKLKAARESNQNKSLVIMAPGLGKTATSAFELQRLLAREPGRVLYLCNQRHVLRSACGTYQQIIGEQLRPGFLFGGKRPPKNANFVLATFQTMVNAREVYLPDYFRYVVVDEVHHARAETFEPTVRYFTPENMLGLTATLRRSDGLDVVELFDGRPPVFDVGLPKALARGLTCGIDYRVMTDEIDYGRLMGVKVGRMGLAGLNKTIFVPKRDQEIVRLILERTAHVKNLRMLVFCASRRHANVIAKHLPNATCIHSGFSASVNDTRLVAFAQGKFSTAVTVDMINEGVNIPEINVIVFLRTIQWYGLFLQQLGRGTRLYEGKESLLVLDFASNCQRIEAVMALQREVAEAMANEPREATARERAQPFLLTVGQVGFAEQDVKIVELIQRIEAGNTVESLTELLLMKATELGGSPRAYQVDEDSRMPHSRTFVAVLKVRNWNAVLVKVGLKPFTLDGLTKDELIDRMQKLTTKLTHTPACDTVDASPDFPAVRKMLDIFGVATWNALVVACGLRIRRSADMTNEERKVQLAAELIAKTKALGRAPRGTELDDDPNMASCATYIKVFGCPYRQILHRFGLLKNSPENLAEGLNKLRIKLKRLPSTADVSVDSSLPSIGTFYRAFQTNTWAAVLEAAWKILGIDL